MGGVAVILAQAYFYFSGMEFLKNFSGFNLLLCATLSFFIYSQMCFFYVINIYGPYESSLSVRLLRELAKVHPKGLTQDQILTSYNAQLILRTRLERLVGSGEVVQEGDRYRIGKKQNIFFVLEFSSRQFHKFISKIFSRSFYE